MTGPRWLFLEPYYGGSHRHLVDLLVDRLPIDAELWTLPPRKWKWRMRGAALQFADRAHRDLGNPGDLAGIFTSSLLDAAALRGLLPRKLRDLPLILYCHENQLDYPVLVDDRRDYGYAWTNIQSLLAADRLLWNSAYNRDSFLAALPAFLRRLPDHRPGEVGERIRESSTVLPVPLGLPEGRPAPPDGPLKGEPPPRRGPCRILWNHRWEHDKAPEIFLEALLALAGKRVDFEVAVLGQAFQRRPEIFERARAGLGDRVAVWGFRESREDYLRELAKADVAVSTARHEFQGLAILEAAAHGAVPLVPDALAYPEIWPDELRYPPGRLLPALRSRIAETEAWRAYDPRPFCRPYTWEALEPAWRAVFAPIPAAAGAYVHRFASPFEPGAE